MKISPISFSVPKSSFRGQYVYNAYEGDYKNQKQWHPNSTVEKTLGAFHSSVKGNAYFADPLEPISDRIKESVDYVIYDNEPSYPDVNEEVSKNYFGTLRKNFRDDFEEIRKYYYRREQGGYADKTDAQYQQWQAAECTRLYDKAGHLRFLKETAEDKIANLDKDKADILAGIKNTELELASQEGLKMNVEEEIKTLEQLQALYKQIKRQLVEGSRNEDAMFLKSATRVTNARNASKSLKYGNYEVTTANYRDVHEAKKSAFSISENTGVVTEEVNKIAKTIEDFKKIKAGCEKTLEGMKALITELKAKAGSIDAQIVQQQIAIKDYSKKLIPLFDELKNFYAKQGIKVIKKG